MQELHSKLDKSVNFVEENLKGFIESRYVRRAETHFSCYLSSQTGCNKGCRFCHLTATKQTVFEDETPEGFLNQAKTIFEQFEKERGSATRVHYSFMARGEALSNKFIVNNADDVLLPLAQLAHENKVYPKFNISTIMPRSIIQQNNTLLDMFKTVTPTLYYSLYSMNEAFRRKWIPQGIPVEQALDYLAEYQYATKKIVKIHFPFIKGENDSIVDLTKVFDAIDKVNLAVEFNLVRYNPFSPDQGEESDEETIQRNFDYIQTRVRTSKVIKRVGMDCKASCGMFVDKDGNV